VNPGDQVITEGALGLDDKAKITITKPGDEDSSDKADKKDEDSDKK
jgi:hypothetical protein